MKTMIKFENEIIKTAYQVVPSKNVEKFIELVAEGCDRITTYEVGKMPLEELPVEIQEKAKGILRAFNEVNVTYEHGQFWVSAGYCVRASYGRDHFVCGYYKQEEVYTKEERRQNFIEEFGYAPCYL